MKYWDEMRNKWGFEDGENVPEGAALYREAYIRAVNEAAERDGMGYRAFPLDRGGAHNPCMIAILPKDHTGTADPEAWAMHDGALSAQIAEAMGLGVDSALEVTVRLDDDALQTILGTVAEVEPVACARCGQALRMVQDTWVDEEGYVACMDWTGHDRDGVYAPTHSPDRYVCEQEDLDAVEVHPDAQPCWRCTVEGTDVLDHLRTAPDPQTLMRLLTAAMLAVAPMAETEGEKH